MKKVALVFVMAVIVPSIVLAWLALRSVRDQQFLLERQQAASYQTLAGALVREVNGVLEAYHREFNERVDQLRANRKSYDVAGEFDARLRAEWPMAEVAFMVSLEGEGQVLAPSLFAGPAARTFRLENDRFLCNKEAVEVYWNSPDLAAKGKGLAEYLAKAKPGADEKKGESEKSVFATKSGKVPDPTRKSP